MPATTELTLIDGRPIRLDPEKVDILETLDAKPFYKPMPGEPDMNPTPSVKIITLGHEYIVPGTLDDVRRILYPTSLECLEDDEKRRANKKKEA